MMPSSPVRERCLQSFRQPPQTNTFSLKFLAHVLTLTLAATGHGAALGSTQQNIQAAGEHWTSSICCSHQTDATDGIGEDRLSPKTNSQPRHSSNGQEGLDVDVQDLQVESELSLMHGCADKGGSVGMKQHLRDCCQALAADLQHLPPESEPGLMHAHAGTGTASVGIRSRSKTAISISWWACKTCMCVGLNKMMCTTSRPDQATLDMGRLLGVSVHDQSHSLPSYRKESGPHKTLMCRPIGMRCRPLSSRFSKRCSPISTSCRTYPSACTTEDLPAYTTCDRFGGLPGRCSAHLEGCQYANQHNGPT